MKWRIPCSDYGPKYLRITACLRISLSVMIDDICYQFDLSKPIWLDSTVADFKKHDKTRFTQDNFIDRIDFDYLEIHVIEEG